MSEHENEGGEQDRRKFLKTLGLGGAAAGLGLLTTNPAVAKTTITPSKVKTDALDNIASINGGGSAINITDGINVDEINNIRFASAFDGADGGEQIQNAIDAAAGSGTVIVNGAGPDSGVWQLNSALTLPSDTTLIVANATIQWAPVGNGQMSNLVRNSDLTNGNSNIAIIGLGNAVFDHTSTNTGDRNLSPEDLGFRFYKCDNIEVRNVTIKDTHAWGTKLEDCTDCLVDVEYRQTGNESNQDGCKVVGPGSDIDIRVRGVTADDSASASTEENQSNFQDGTGGDIQNVTFNVRTQQETSVDSTSAVRLFGDDTNTLENITVEKIHAKDYNFALHIGAPNFSGLSTTATCRDISVQQIQVDNVNSAVKIDESVGRLSINSIEGTLNDAVIATADRTIDQLSVENVNARTLSPDSGVGEAIALGSGATANNWSLRNWTLDNWNTVFNGNGSGSNNYANGFTLVDDGNLFYGANLPQGWSFGTDMPPVATSQETLSGGGGDIFPIIVPFGNAGNQVQYEVDEKVTSAPTDVTWEYEVTNTSVKYDNSSDDLQLVVQTSWNVDPGDGNDVGLEYRVYLTET